MTENGYFLNAGDHQALTDFLQAVVLSKLTKARMASLAGALVDQLNAVQADTLPEEHSSPEADRIETASSREIKIELLEAIRARNALILDLQNIAGFTGNIDAVVKRLWEVRECVDALLKLPSKAGVANALGRVLKLRTGLLTCLSFIGQVVETCRGIEEFDQMPDSLASDLERLGDTGRIVWQETEALAKPPAPQ